MLAQASVVEHRAHPGVGGDRFGGHGRRHRQWSRRALSTRRIARGAGTRRRLDQLTGGTSTAGTPRKRNRHREPSRRSHPAAADRLRCAADVGNLLAAALRSRRADAIQDPAPRRPARRVPWMARMPAVCRRGGRRSSRTREAAVRDPARNLDRRVAPASLAAAAAVLRQRRGVARRRCAAGRHAGDDQRTGDARGARHHRCGPGGHARGDVLPAAPRSVTAA